jgi:hypothetical protein
MKAVACSGHKISTPRPPRRRTLVHPSHIKKAIQHANNLCLNYENTQECRIAWEHVEELSAEMNRQVSAKDSWLDSPEI